MIIYTIFIFVILAICIAGENMEDTKKRFLIVFIGFFMALFTGLRGPGVDVDYPMLSGYFKIIYPIKELFTNPVHFFSVKKIEPMFLVTASIIKALFKSNAFNIFLLLIAFFSVFFKTIAIQKYSNAFLYSLFIYCCNYFLLHDITQVRAGLALGIVMMSFEPLVERNFKKFAGIIIIATLFHYSAIIFMPLYFLSTKKINGPFYIGIMIVSFVLCVLKIDPASLLLKFDFGVYSQKVVIYRQMQAWQKTHINLFNLPVIFHILLSFFFIYFKEELAKNTKYGIIFLKMNIISICLFYLFSGLVAFAFRLYEALNIVQIFLIPYMLYVIKPKWLAQLIIILIGLGLYLNYVQHGLLNSYKLFFMH